MERRMTKAIQLVSQHIGPGRPSKFVPTPLSAPLFAGAARRQLEADEALFIVGEPGDGCYQLEKGLLKVVITSLLGKDRILAVLGPGAIVGELAMIDKGSRSASVFALKRCELSFISRAGFKDRTTRNPEIYQHLMNVLVARLRQTDESMAASSFLPIKARLARALSQLGGLCGEDEGPA